jgi:hypothetical protein
MGHGLDLDLREPGSGEAASSEHGNSEHGSRYF